MSLTTCPLFVARQRPLRVSAGATEAGKAALGGAARDAYERLKSAASRLLGSSVADLEAKPQSGNRAGVVAEKVEEQSRPNQAELEGLAEALRAALGAEGRGATIDKRVTVTASGTGAIAAGRDVRMAAPPKPS